MCNLKNIRSKKFSGDANSGSRSYVIAYKVIVMSMAIVLSIGIVNIVELVNGYYSTSPLKSFHYRLSASNTRPHTEQNIKHQLNFNHIDDQEWADQWLQSGLQPENGLTLDNNGMYAVDSNLLFLYGNISTGAASLQSYLLRSDDGGKNWQDVMQPIAGSSVINLFFLNKNIGWALVAWTTEGPGELNLYHTNDAGQHWQKVTEVPKRNYMGWPLDFSFTTEQNGVMRIEYDGYDDNDGVDLLVTKDGGKTWAISNKLPIPKLQDSVQSSANNGNNEKLIMGQDGSRWNLQKVDNQLRILKRSELEDKLHPVCSLSIEVKNSNGMINTSYITFD